MAIDEDSLADLRSRGGDIIENIAAKYVALRRVGTRWVGLCPFHGEKSPSFNVNATEGLYYCFGCQASGDFIKLIQELEQVDFVTAARMAAKDAGITLKETEQRTAPDPYRGLLSEVATRWQHALPRSAHAADYVQGRGITEDELDKFRIGYCPKSTSHWIEGLDTDLLAKAGLISADDHTYSLFAGRVIFPWSDLTGVVRGFGGRDLTGNAKSKYVNSASGPTFDKGSLLYGLHQARPHIRKTNTAVICEGYFDVVAAHRAGTRNAVAACGTAITAGHVNLLARMAGDADGRAAVTLLTDGDTEGVKAARRAAKLDWRAVTVRVASLPDGVDPDDLVASDPEAFNAVVATAHMAVDTILDEVLTWDLADPRVHADAVTEMGEVIAATVPTSAAHITRERVANQLRTSPFRLIPTPKNQARQPAAADNTDNTADADVPAIQYSIIRALLEHPLSAIPWFEPEWMTHPDARTAAEAVWEPGYQLADIISRLPPNPAALLTRAANDPVPMSAVGVERNLGAWLAGLAEPTAGTNPAVIAAIAQARKGNTDAMHQLFNHLSANIL